jgi:hypothetical protein
MLLTKNIALWDNSGPELDNTLLLQEWLDSFLHHLVLCFNDVYYEVSSTPLIIHVRFWCIDCEIMEASVICSSWEQGLKDSYNSELQFAYCQYLPIHRLHSISTPSRCIKFTQKPCTSNVVTVASRKLARRTVTAKRTSSV